MTRPRIAQLDQSGATVGQVPVWDAAGYWKPGNAAGITMCRTVLVATGGETIVYLNATPTANTEQIFVNGVLKLWTTDYTLAGTVATLAVALTASDKVAVHYIATTTCGIAALGKPPRGFHRPTPLTRPVRRFHRIR